VIGNDRHFLSGSKVYVAGSFTGLQSAIIDNSVVPAGWSEDYIGLVSQTDLPLRLAGGDSGSPIFTPQGLLVGIYTGRVDDANGPRVGFLARTAVLETKVKLATWDNRHDWRDSAAD
jgi:S1-C subfamily serine protease